MELNELTDNAASVADLLKMLANAQRLLILCKLQDEEMSVGRIHNGLGLSSSALSQHLAKLREAGLVQTRRDAQTIHYRLADPRLIQLMATLSRLYCSGEIKT